MSVDLERVSRALGDPRRLQILRLVAESPGMACCEIVAKTQLSQPTVSHHIKELNGAGLLRVRREGNLGRCEVDAEAMEAYLSEMRRNLLPTAELIDGHRY